MEEGKQDGGNSSIYSSSSDDDDDDDHFLSPFGTIRRESLRISNNQKNATPGGNNENSNRRHSSSGSIFKTTPVNSNHRPLLSIGLTYEEDDDDDDNNTFVEPYRQALHKSLSLSNDEENDDFDDDDESTFINERSSLLLKEEFSNGNNNQDNNYNNPNGGRRRKNNNTQQQQQQQQQQKLSRESSVGNISNIGYESFLNHSMVEDNNDKRKKTIKAKRRKLTKLYNGDCFRRLSITTILDDGIVSMRNVVCYTSAIHFCCMALHDFYICYISYRRFGTSIQNNLLATLPFITPMHSTMKLFGLFLPNTILSNKKEYWRFLTSIFTCNSLVEVSTIWLSWYFLITVITGSVMNSIDDNDENNHNNIWYLTVVYLGSALAGQLLLVLSFSFHINEESNDNEDGVVSIYGCALWGTCGILCSTTINLCYIVTRPYVEGMKKQQITLLLTMQALLFAIDVLRKYNIQNSIIPWGCISSSLFGYIMYYVSSVAISSKHDYNSSKRNNGNVLEDNHVKKEDRIENSALMSILL